MTIKNEELSRIVKNIDNLTIGQLLEVHFVMEHNSYQYHEEPKENDTYLVYTDEDTLETRILTADVAVRDWLKDFHWIRDMELVIKNNKVTIRLNHIVKTYDRDTVTFNSILLRFIVEYTARQEISRRTAILYGVHQKCHPLVFLGREEDAYYRLGQMKGVAV